MNAQVRDVGMVVMAIVIVVVAVMGFPRIDKALKSQTMADCANAAKTASAEGGFNGGVYKICVEDAGYTTQIK